jgi:molybdenum cofactor cytidylyltransferase
MLVGAIILAAGESKRMGKPKLLLPFGDKTIVETVVTNVIQSKADEALVVLGADPEKIEEKIKDLPVTITVNPHYKKGMLSSVQWGFNAIPENIQGVLICLGDQPSIPPSVMDKVIESFKSSKKGIIVPAFNKNRGHPVLIDVKYRKEIEDLSPDVGLRGIVYNHPRDTMEVEVDTPAVLRDIDNPDDYMKETEDK